MRQIAANSPQALIATNATVDRASEIDDRHAVENDANVKLRQSRHHEQFRDAAAPATGNQPPETR